LEHCIINTKCVISDFSGLSYWSVLPNISTTTISSCQNFAHFGNIFIKTILKCKLFDGLVSGIDSGSNGCNDQLLVSCDKDDNSATIDGSW
jgi:hypothetical protein